MKITPLGIPLMSYAGDILVVLEVLIDFAGDRKILCRGRSFRGLLAEDNPVISCYVKKGIPVD